MPIQKQWVLAQKRMAGLPHEEDFELREDHTADIGKGDVLCRALFLSVDPITRLYMNYGMIEGECIPGRQVARIVESKHKDFPKGKLIYGSMGWQTYSVINPDSTQEMSGETVKLIESLPKQLDYSGLPKSAILGALGVPGISAYIGLLKVCKAKNGETLVISSAAGQMGHIAGQIAKYLGMKVLGFTGDADKSSWLKTELGYEWAFNYKTQDVRQALKIAAPQGVDVFLDSVGGIFHYTVLEHMARNGRVCIFGTLSAFNNCANVPMVPAMDMAIAIKELKIFGFNYYSHLEYVEEARDQLAEWCQDGTIEPFEHVIEGFENLPKTLIAMLEGKSQGKVIVRV